MKPKIHSKSGFLGSRALLILLLCAAASSILAGTLLAFLGPDAPAKVSQRTPDPKPSLDAVMSQAKLENKVEDYLCNSQALEDYWQRPITAEQLQAEMERMAQHTKQAKVLRELFEALGKDPYVIAECLARPALSERLVTN